MTINSEIRDIIEKELPTMAAGKMKEFITRAEGVQEQLDKAEQLILEQKKELTDYGNEEARYQSMDEREAKLDEVEKGLDDTSIMLEAQSRNMELILSNQRRESMAKTMKMMETLVSKVFGHPSVTITSQRKIPVQQSTQGQYGQEGGEYIQDYTESETKTEGKE